MSTEGFNNSSTTASCNNGTCLQDNTGRFHHYRGVEPEQLKVFRFVLIGVVLFASVVGNSIVIRAIIGKRAKPFVYCLVTNLAVGELITTVCIPFVITYSELASWIFGDFLCRLILPLQATSVTVVTTTIAVISIRRYQVVTGIGMHFPASKRGVYLVISCIWLYAFIVCSPLFILYQTSTRFTSKAVYCLAAYPNNNDNWYGNVYQWYTIVRIVLCFGVQVTVMILSYGAVTINLKKQLQSILKNARTSRIDSTMSITRVTDYNLEAQRNSASPHHQMVPLQQIITRAQEVEQNPRPEINVLLDQEGDLTKMFYIIVLVFIVFYLPANIYHILEINKSFKWFRYMFVLRKYLALLSYFTLALHPLCYGTMSRFYAEAFKKLILCKC